jgi:hypothetical protein
VSDPDDGILSGVIAILVLVTICGLSFCIGQASGTGLAHEEAVKAGKAEYYLDANNQRQWRWKP